jgi:tripartite-type tricarboxylate transporter receptor subunit TctC
MEPVMSSRAVAACPSPTRTGFASMTPLLTRLLVAATVAMPAVCLAGYPDHPISLIVPFPAGAGTDMTGRTIAQCIEKTLPGAQVVVLNRPGASGDIGLAALAAAAPDGYTLGIVNTPGVVSIPIERPAKYTLDSFDFIANLVDDPGTISVHADSPIRSIKDLVAAARARPDAVTVGTQGIGSAGHISALLLEQSAGITLSSVPFQGASPARTALLGKVIDSTMANMGEAITFQAGQPWRILGVMSDSRSQQSPDIPTFREAGYDILAGSMRGLAAPKGLPAPVLMTLSKAVEQCSTDADFIERAKKTFQPLRYLGRDEYVSNLREVDTQLRALWKVKPWNR